MVDRRRLYARPREFYLRILHPIANVCARRSAAVTLSPQNLQTRGLNQIRHANEGLDEQAVVATTQRWFQRFVVDLKLCPFAAQIEPRIAVSDADSMEQLLRQLALEIQWLQNNDREETTLLVHPAVLTDFLDYNDFLAVCDDLLIDLALEGVFQIASFHPQYQFAGTRAGDPENYANRSPYPMLHILREDSVSRAVDTHPDVAGIPQRNAGVLAKLGSENLRKLWSGCFVND